MPTAEERRSRRRLAAAQRSRTRWEQTLNCLEAGPDTTAGRKARAKALRAFHATEELLGQSPAEKGPKP